MSEISQNITISAVGAGEAAASIGQVRSAMSGIGEMHNELKTRFTERFEHIGLRLFAGDLIRAQGLGGEMRPILSALMLSMNSVGAAMGAASGPIMLVVAGFAALVGIGMKVIEHNQAEAESAHKLVDQQSTSLKGYTDQISALERFEKAGGHLTSAMTNLLHADQAVANDIKGNLLDASEKEIAALEKQAAEIGKAQKRHEEWLAIIDITKRSLEAMWDVLKQVLAPLVMFHNAIAGATTAMTGVNKQVEDHIKLTGSFAEQYRVLIAQIDKAKVEHAQMAKGMETDLSKIAEAKEKETQAHLKSEEKKKKALEDYVKTLQDAGKIETSLQAQIDSDKLDQLNKHYAEAEKAQSDSLKKQMDFAKTVAGEIGKDFGNAFAKMIVEGKNFTQELTQAFKQMAEQIIEQIIKMIIQQQLLLALETATGTVGMGGGAGAGGGFFGGAFATGGSVMVDKPTLFMAGEAGPELATFTPAGRLNGGSGSGGQASSASSDASASVQSNISFGDINVTLQVASLGQQDRRQALEDLAAEIRSRSAAAVRFANTVSAIAGQSTKLAY